MPKDSILSVQGLSKSFIGIKALNKVSLDVKEGEVHGIIGENGAGKSTLMNVVFGDLQRDEGTIIFKNKEVHFKSPAEALSAGISMVHQETSLVQQFTASENIWLGIEDRFIKNGILDKQTRDRATQKLFLELNLPLRFDEIAGQATVATCQLIELTRAVAHNSKLLILDEPSSSLTEHEVEVLFSIIRKLSSENISVIYISHKIEEILKICDRVSVYRDGEHIASMDVEGLTYNKVVSLVVGRELTTLFPKTEVQLGEKILEVNKLTRYGAFSNVSFDLRKGEILGFAGLAGAGRSEVMQCVFGIDKPDSGTIILDGKEVVISDPAKAVGLGIGMVTEDRLRRGIIAQLSVLFNMSIVKLGAFCSKFLGVIDKKQESLVSQKIIDQMKVKLSDIHQRIDSLSGGNQQKVILGRWIMMNPRILILDEPTRGIDVGSKSEIHKLMGDFVKAGMSIILISAELPELLGMADRIIVMREGSVVYKCDRKDATQELIGKYALG